MYSPSDTQPKIVKIRLWKKKVSHYTGPLEKYSYGYLDGVKYWRDIVRSFSTLTQVKRITTCSFIKDEKTIML